MSYVLKNKEVKIKQAKTCWGCGEKKHSGSHMTYVVTVIDSVFDTTYWCEVCNTYLIENSEYFDDGVRFSEFRGERDYDDFKKNYLYPDRIVLFEKFNFWGDIRRMTKNFI